MSKTLSVFLCVSVFALSACGNTAYGLKKDGQQTSSALDDASSRVLRAGTKK